MAKRQPDNGGEIDRIGFTFIPKDGAERAIYRDYNDPVSGFRIRSAVMPRWFKPFLQQSVYKCAFGGRSASKTRNVAQWLIAQAFNRHMRCACVREVGHTLDESLKLALEWAIDRLDLGAYFKVGAKRIRCLRNGSEFFFRGVGRNPENVKGWEGVTHVWADEAQRLTHAVMRLLIPTVTRGDYIPEIWITFNPTQRTEWAYDRFVTHPELDDVTVRVNWHDNPWFPQTANKERLRDYRLYPNLYTHIWEGEPDDGDASTTVLPYSYLKSCTDAWKAGWHLKADLTPAHGGLDIADAGDNHNALVTRTGPLVTYAKSWPTRTPGILRPTARSAHNEACRADLWRLYYDSSGVGAPIRGEFMHIWEDPAAYAAANYSLKPISFGGEVEGKETLYTKRKKNKDAFSKRNAQLAFALRNRARQSTRLMSGEPVNPNTCLFIPGDLPGLQRFLNELTRPKWLNDPLTAKIKLDKTQKATGGNLESPDLFDALSMAFAYDSEGGLKIPW